MLNDFVIKGIFLYILKSFEIYPPTRNLILEINILIENMYCTNAMFLSKLGLLFISTIVLFILFIHLCS